MNRTRAIVLLIAAMVLTLIALAIANSTPAYIGVPALAVALTVFIIAIRTLRKLPPSKKSPKNTQK